jgi:hypothetical protein
MILTLPLSRAQSQVPHPHKVVRGGDEREVPGNLLCSYVVVPEKVVSGRVESEG